MNRLRGHVSFGLIVVCAVFLAACEKNPAAPTTTPAPAPTPAPTPPPAPTFTVSGTISETAPTASNRIGDVQVALSGGPSTTTAGDGTFTLTGVTAGTYTLTASKADFDTRTMQVIVGTSNVSGLQINMPPTFRIITVEHIVAIAPEEPSCHGTTRPCDVYTFSTHHAGRFEATLEWSNDVAELDLELRCGGEVVEEAMRKGGTTEEMVAQVPADRGCELNVFGGGDPATYKLVMKRPI